MSASSGVSNSQAGRVIAVAAVIAISLSLLVTPIDPKSLFNAFQFGLSLVTALATAWAAIAASKAAKSAEQSIFTSREIGRDQSRAYVQAQHAFVVHDNARTFHVEMIILNSGATPCTWFGYKCYAIHGDVSSAVPFNRELFRDIPLRRWNGLANGGEGLNLKIADKEVSEAIDLANKSVSGFRIDGVIAYETFFSEVFETEFSFFVKPMTDSLLFTRISKEDIRHGTKLSRTTRILNSYRKISG
jgi:hypothetical protein